MIDINNLTYFYPGTERPTLRDFTLHIPAHTFVLVSGESGSGKSTLLRAINGLVPHFYGGKFSGRVTVNGLNTITTPPREIAGQVGFVFQDPEAQFVVETVEDELAFGLENLGVSPEQMPARIEQALADVGALHLKYRQVHSLSGGEAQRVAVASVLAMRPRVLVLDEPTSQLDPPGAAGLLDVLVDLHRKYEMTIILAEHRLARVLPFATHMLVLGTSGSFQWGEAAQVIAQSQLRPPFLQAACHLGWQPLPRSLNEAKKRAHHVSSPPDIPIPPQPAGGEVILSLRNIAAGYENNPVIHDLSWELYAGECMALMGANGAGKSTLLKMLAGLLKPSAGAIHLMDKNITRQRLHQRAKLVAYVPQNPNSILFAETLQDELAFTLRGLRSEALEEPETFLAELGLVQYANRYPRDLSGGERQRAALAAMLIACRSIMLLDEPTRGMDYTQRNHLVQLIRKWVRQGHSIVLATHDVELAARVARRVVIMDNGQIVQQGSPREIFLHTPGYQTQLAQIFGRTDLLTTDDLHHFPISQ
jgi:energy-coupling factor transport system ATP-binding protein